MRAEVKEIMMASKAARKQQWWEATVLLDPKRREELETGQVGTGRIHRHNPRISESSETGDVCEEEAWV